MKVVVVVRMGGNVAVLLRSPCKHPVGHVLVMICSLYGCPFKEGVNRYARAC